MERTWQMNFRKAQFWNRYSKEAVENYLFPYKNTGGRGTNGSEFPLFDESVVQKVIELPEIEKAVCITYGCYASYDYSEDYTADWEYGVWK